MRDGIESLSALHFYADLSNFLKDRHYNHLPAFIQIRHAAGTVSNCTLCAPSAALGVSAVNLLLTVTRTAETPSTQRGRRDRF
jgi:3-deoxy-D-arabino-heptulosonate 7-phosphate (DAHP) synthase